MVAFASTYNFRIWFFQRIAWDEKLTLLDVRRIKTTRVEFIWDGSGGAAVGGIGSDEPNDRLVIALQVLFITLFITLTTPLIQSAEPIDLVG
jgi:hypothetical protein